MNIDDKLEKLKHIALDFGITADQWEGFEPHLEQAIKQLIDEEWERGFEEGWDYGFSMGIGQDSKDGG